MKSNKNIWNISMKIIAIGTVTLALIYGIKYWSVASSYQSTNDAQVESYINPVSARVGGYIKEVLFKEHQFVRKGDTLVILDDREYQAQKNIADATLEATVANLVVLNASIQSAKTGTLVNENQISSAEANLWKQRQDIERYIKLVKEEAVTQSDFELVKTQYEIADNNYKATSNTLKTSLTKIKELESKRALLNADINRAKANLSLAQINLSYTVISSPFTGFTGRKNILEGQQVQPGQPLVSIVNENSKWITANFKETQVKGMYVGQSVEIEIDAFPGRIFKGEIAAIAAATGSEFSLLPSDNSSGNFVKVIQRIPVKIEFKEIDISQVKTGMNVNVSVNVSTKG
tara:strand:+ start:54387 stop:55427 length:1041 start_codon:yes stop_codon:yes gene_type:complete